MSWSLGVTSQPTAMSCCSVVLVVFVRARTRSTYCLLLFGGVDSFVKLCEIVRTTWVLVLPSFVVAFVRWRLPAPSLRRTSTRPLDCKLEEKRWLFAQQSVLSRPCIPRKRPGLSLEPERNGLAAIPFSPLFYVRTRTEFNRFLP